MKIQNIRLLFVTLLVLALPVFAGAAVIINDTFADANSQNQDLSNNSVRLFNGRAGTVRTDSAGSVNFNIAAAGGSEGFWGFFTESGAPVTLGVGDKLSVSARFALQNVGANLGADLRFGLFDSRQTRTAANTTGGINSPTFSDDPGYATRLAGTTGGTPPFTVHRRTIPSATDPLANVISTTVAEYTALTVSGGTARAPLANGTPYTLTFTVERTSATDTKVTISVTDGGAFNLSTTATETSASPATTFDWFGFRVPNGFASDVTFSQLSANYTPAAPVITAQPQPSNLTVQVGSNVNMSVAASGSALSYQWYRNGVALAGNVSASTPTLNITNAQVADTGNYTAVVSNAGGSTTSTPVQLTVSEGEVAPPPSVVAGPADTTVTAGAPASLSVAAEGQGLFYQWYKNGALIPGASNATLDFAAAQVSDAGSYHVVVSNSGGNVASAPARLLVVSSMTATSFAPANGATDRNIDAPLQITFDQTPLVGTSGKVRVFNAADNSLVDTVDLGVDTNTGVHAPGPQSARSIGGSSWQFNYHPVVVNGNTATIYTKTKLAYGQSYYVTVEPGVIIDATGAPFVGLTDANAWRFSTKQSGPAAGTTELTVASDGSGDFDTVQGAVDFVPTNNTQRVVITVKRGTYTEIVYVRSSKPFVTVRGEDRNESVVQYPNNENLNTGSSPRATFGVDATDFVLENITVHNTTTRFNGENRTRQSEAFRGNNHRILLNRVNLKSFQDTLLLQNQAGSNQGGFVNESYIEGDIDFLWGTGVVYFRNSELKMVNSNAYYTQIRNDATKNGYVFVNSRLTAAPGVTGAYLSRIDPDQFPYSQVVFIDSQMGPHVRPEAWRFDNPDLPGGATAANYPNIKFWEYNTTDAGGNAVDVSQRHPLSRQITAEEAAYWRDPANVLGGWVPELGTTGVSLAGLSQTYTGSPVGVSVITEPANLSVQVTYNGSTEQPVAAGSYEVVATVTEPGYQGAANGTLVIEKAAASVTLDNLAQTADGSPKSVVVTTEPAGLGVTVTYNGAAEAPVQPGTYAVVATVNDANYQGTASGVLNVSAPANTAPVLALPSDLTVEATSAAGAVVNFTAGASDNEDGALNVNLSRASGSTFPVGATTVTASVTDSAGSTATGTFNVTVRDTTAPVFRSLTASPATITKANGKMTSVQIAAGVADAVDATPTTRIVSVTSNEPVGSTSPDWQITGALTLNVRAERDVKGSGRVYTVTVESADDAGNVSRQTVTVSVPR
ncbi:MAG TPA: pectinesterase family protein [Pyrinomonadaceae bacterium]|nr:pectinesterase family protein [Pyrinomonadaceae bacterium]